MVVTAHPVTAELRGLEESRPGPPAALSSRAMKRFNDRSQRRIADMFGAKRPAAGAVCLGGLTNLGAHTVWPLCQPLVLALSLLLLIEIRDVCACQAQRRRSLQSGQRSASRDSL